MRRVDGFSTACAGLCSRCQGLLVSQCYFYFLANLICFDSMEMFVGEFQLFVSVSVNSGRTKAMGEIKSELQKLEREQVRQFFVTC